MLPTLKSVVDRVQRPLRYRACRGRGSGFWLRQERVHGISRHEGKVNIPREFSPVQKSSTSPVALVTWTWTIHLILTNLSLLIFKVTINAYVTWFYGDQI